MLILLPPSETKRDGGGRAALSWDGLSFPSLRPQRELVLDALLDLSAEPEVMARVLKLGVSQASEIAANAALRTAPTLPAVDRYTGVLYDALDAAVLPAAARRWVGSSVAIQSALFGLIGALDRIPVYRLSAGSSLPGLPALRRIWADAVTAAVADAQPSFVLDLRSEAYVALGPVPESVAHAYVRVVAEGPDGTVRALNHFNKHAKGALVRALAEDRPRVRSAAGLRGWAGDRGIRMRVSSDREIVLVVT